MESSIPSESFIKFHKFLLATFVSSCFHNYLSAPPVVRLHDRFAPLFLTINRQSLFEWIVNFRKKKTFPPSRCAHPNGGKFQIHLAQKVIKKCAWNFRDKCERPCGKSFSLRFEGLTGTLSTEGMTTKDSKLVWLGYDFLTFWNVLRVEWVNLWPAVARKLPGQSWLTQLVGQLLTLMVNSQLSVSSSLHPELVSFQTTKLQAFVTIPLQRRWLLLNSHHVPVWSSSSSASLSLPSCDKGEHRQSCL